MGPPPPGGAGAATPPPGVPAAWRRAEWACGLPESTIVGGLVRLPSVGVPVGNLRSARITAKMAGAKGSPPSHELKNILAESILTCASAGVSPRSRSRRHRHLGQHLPDRVGRGRG